MNLTLFVNDECLKNHVYEGIFYFERIFLNEVSHTHLEFRMLRRLISYLVMISNKIVAKQLL